ncbi:putative polyketide synthase [Hypoxylon fuscum]|nr:putative polyketide synthase [Hypoxylon fuscum]
MPIAIIGISGRFPGDAENPQKLWDMVSEGRSALCDIPEDRFNVDAFYHPHNERQGTLNVRKAHFMSTRDVSAFDAPFFTMPVPEVRAMDPQQRMALECTYEALENAGLRMEDVHGSDTSCFIGCFTRDYSEMLCDAEDLPLYHGTGTGSAIMSNRVSWFYNLKGPSISLDTACSSSMAALHLGCQSLRTGETTMSVIGGTNLMLMPDIMGAMTRLHFLSPDGKCHSFDHRANGYSRGEGAAFCVLKPLHLALQDGDVIRGVIRNTGVNQDGNTPGITLPSAEAQEALIRKVYKEAGLSLADTTYVEAHGTGTPAGDPVEAAALAATFGKSRARGDPLWMGSIKSNVGHLEGGSGLVQVIKAIMMLESGEIPPSIWFEKPNPRIPMDDWNLAVPTQLMSWPVDGLRRISINSFGYGGTNAHCVLDDAYHYLRAHRLVGNHNVRGIESALSTPDSGIQTENSSQADNTSSSHKLIVWTSHEQAGTERNARIYASYLNKKVAKGMSEKDDEVLFKRFCRTLASRRSIMPWRSFAIAGSSKDAAAILETSKAKPIRVTKTNIAPPVAFVFTGQGAQWYAMGRELYSQPVARQSLEAAGKYFANIGSHWSLISEMFRDEETSRLAAADLSQPVCTAVQVAIVDLLRSWGVEPAAVVGHSSGEIAAAYAKGAITREDAWKIAYFRGHLSSCIRGFAPGLKGGMLATGLGFEDAQPYIARLSKGNATIACINSPNSTTISGDSDAIDELENLMKDDGHFARRLRVDVAYHSPHMRIIAEKYRQALGDLKTLPENGDGVKMFSSLTGESISNHNLDTQYWVSNIVSPVKFSEALKGLLTFSGGSSKRRSKKAYIEHLIEIGPHSALEGPIKQIMGQDALASSTKDITYQSVLLRNKNACETALNVAGRLFQYGYPLSLEAVNNDTDTSQTRNFLVDMPPFGWNHDLKYWFEPHQGRAHRFRKHIRKDLFGSETRDLLPEEPRFRNILRLNEVPWMQYHTVQGSILYPGAGMMIMAIEAMCQKAIPGQPIAGYELRDVIINKAIVVPDDEDGVETMLTIKPFRHGSQALTASWQEFTLFSRKDEWGLNCSGLIRIDYKADDNQTFTNEESIIAAKHSQQYIQIRENCSRSQGPRQFYENLDSIGLHYGGVFQSLVEIKKGQYQATGRLRIPDTKSVMPVQFEFPHVIHPATLDSIVQLALPASTQADEELTVPMVPVSVDRVYVSAEVPSTPGVTLAGYAKSKLLGHGDGESTIVVSDEAWSKPLVIFEGLKGKKLTQIDNEVSDVSMRKLGTYFHWQQDLALLEPAQVRDFCMKTVGSLGQVDRKILIEVEMACFIVIKRVLQQCSVAEADKFAWNFKLFHEYMQHCYRLAEQGKLCYQSETSVDWLNMSVQAEDELLGRVAESSTDGAALVEHGKYLPEILRGDVPPLQILMKDNFLHNFYQSGLGTAQHYAQMSWYVDMQAHKNPTMKILEIGGGTAGATLPILEALGGANGTAPRFSQYTFTDISVGFFEKARDKLAPWTPYMNFAKLNIEQDPVAQGFEEGGYDLIVASNVLHATRFIGTTLANARKLLKPNGKLVLTEVTNSSRKMRFHMIVGSLEGWWYGEDDGRHLGPTLDIEQWHSALLGAGFDGIELDLPDFLEAQDTGLSVIISGASAPAPTPSPEDVLVVLPESASSELSACAAKVTEQLKQAGTKATALTLPETVDMKLESKSCLCLVDAEKNKGYLPEISESNWDLLKRVILTCRDTTYVTRGGTVNSENPSANLMTGMARSIRSENYSLALTTLDLEYDMSLDDEENVITPMLRVFKMGGAEENDDDKLDREYAIRNGKPMVQRVLLEKSINNLASTWYQTPKPKPGTLPVPSQEDVPRLALGVGTPGRLDTLRFEKDKEWTSSLGPNEVEITVKAGGLNFKDVMVAMGQLAQPALGVECSGIVRRVGISVTNVKVGEPVMTWKLDTFSNLVRAPAAMVQPLSGLNLDFATAASLPVIYSTAHYSLSTIARLQPGETLLIHGAAGGVGQAAIMLAQHIGATIFATVSTEAKKALLVEKYGIPESHVLNSRDSKAFSQAVLRLTDGRGVDVVLNSLAGEALRAGWRAIARFGRFIELGQRDIVGNTGLDMAPFLRNVSFHAVNMLDLLDYNEGAAARALAEVVDLLRKGAVKPVTPITALPFSKAEEAFRLMQTGKHTGKIVLEVIEGDVVPIVPTAVQPVSLSPDATYVIAGGGGGLGRSLTEWMVKSGARHVLLLSRSGSKKTTTKDLIRRLAKGGVHVDAWECDVGSEKSLVECLDRARVEMWPAIKGVVQGAMVLNDAIYQNMSRQQFFAATQPKVQGSWYLHKHLPADMDFFVLLSSSVGIAGSRGQGNYSAGNTYEDALAHYRRNAGLPACSIDVGMVLGVGFLAEETTGDRVHDNVKSWSFLGIREREFLGVMDAAIRGESMPGQAVPPQLITGLGTGGMMARGATKYPWWFKDAKFRHIVHVDTDRVAESDGEDGPAVGALLAQASSFEQAVDLVVDVLINKLAKSLMVSAEDIEGTRPVSSYGVDSLLAVELRAWIFSEIKAEVSVFELLSNEPITSLARKIAEKSKAVPETFAAGTE